MGIIAPPSSLEDMLPCGRFGIKVSIDSEHPESVSVQTAEGPILNTRPGFNNNVQISESGGFAVLFAPGKREVAIVDVKRISLVVSLLERLQAKPAIAKPLSQAYRAITDMVPRWTGYLQVKDAWLDTGYLHIGYGRSELVLPMHWSQRNCWYANRETRLVINFDSRNPDYTRLIKTRTSGDGSPLSASTAFARRILQADVPNIMIELQRAKCLGLPPEEVGRYVGAQATYRIEPALHRATMPR